MSDKILIYAEHDVPEHLQMQVLNLHYLAWGGDLPTNVETAHDPELNPVSMLLVRDDVVISALNILSKTIIHGGETYQASGLSTVVTAPSERGKGYGRHLVVEAREEMAKGDVDLGIFTCDTPLKSFYERCGWAHLEGTALIGGTPDEPFPSDQFDKATLGYFFSDKARQHAHYFYQSQIELYPGAIDKLW